MNALQQIDRLKGLLRKIEVNRKKARSTSAVDTAASAPAFTAVAPEIAAAPVAEIATTALPVSDLAAIDAAPPTLHAEVSRSAAVSSERRAEVSVYEPARAEAPSAPIADLSVAAAAPARAEAPVAEEPIAAQAAALPAESSAEPEEFVPATLVTPVPLPSPAAEAEAQALEAEIPITEDGADSSIEVEVVEEDIEDLGLSEVPAADDVVPASSKRARFDQVAEAAAQPAPNAEYEFDVATRTPPPESGPQLGFTGHEPAQAFSPTPEQLGQTVELGEASGPDLELKEEARAAAAPATDLELELPKQTTVGIYDEKLAPPPEAQAELAAHLRDQQSDDVPEAFARRVPLTSDIIAVVPARPRSSQSFVELLDSSLALGKT